MIVFKFIKLTDFVLKFTLTIFDSASKLFGTVKEISNVAFKAGSSQQGKHRLASVAAN